MKFFTTAKLSENMRETPEGYLVCLNVPIARTGDMVYMRGELPEIEADNEGKIIVSRDALEVFRPETIASFEGKSLTLWHPQEFVAPSNWAAVTKGVLQNVRRGTGANENDLLADLLVTDERAIELVKGGLREVSCGYEADYVQTGVGRAIQKNIIGNHLAMVDEGRAGNAYAIMDHKGKGTIMNLSQKIKALLAEEESATPPVTKTADAAALDSVLKAVSALTEKVEALAVSKKKSKDYSTQPTQSAPAQVNADEEVAMSLEDRLAKLEALVAKLTEGMTSDEESEDDEGMTSDEESEDDDGEEVEESEDEACEDEDGEESEDEEAEESEDADVEVAATADAKSRIEILAPGMRASSKDAKAKALKVCYATKDGKALIEKFTGGKAPNFKDANFVNMVFVAASEVLKNTRSEELAKTRTRDNEISIFSPKGAVTAEAINKKNADHYAGKH